jgi:hypothetical protein
MVNVIILSVIMLSVIMLSVVKLNVIMLNVIMLSVVLLNVVAPLQLLATCLNVQAISFQLEKGQKVVETRYRMLLFYTFVPTIS